jgi:hypothetical protein
MFLGDFAQMLGVENKGDDVTAPDPPLVAQVAGEYLDQSQSPAPFGLFPGELLEISGRDPGDIEHPCSILERHLEDLGLPHADKNFERLSGLPAIPVFQDIRRRFLDREEGQRPGFGATHIQDQDITKSPGQPSGHAGSGGEAQSALGGSVSVRHVNNIGDHQRGLNVDMIGNPCPKTS